MSEREPPAPTVRELVVELVVFWTVRVAGAVALILLAAATLGLAVRIFVTVAGLG